MKNLRFAVPLSFVLLLSLFGYSCNQERSGDDQLSQKVQALESKVDALQKRSDDQVLKAEIVNSVIFRSPLEEFFHSAEFFERTYDSGQADCAKRCINANKIAREACAKITDTDEKDRCFQDALVRVTNCQKGCSGL